MFMVEATVRGVSDMYIKVIYSNVNCVTAREFEEAVFKLDAGYYKNILYEVLKDLVKCMGLAGIDPVTAGMALYLNGV